MYYTNKTIKEIASWTADIVHIENDKTTYVEITEVKNRNGELVDIENRHPCPEAIKSELCRQLYGRPHKSVLEWSDWDEDGKRTGKAYIGV